MKPKLFPTAYLLIGLAAFGLINLTTQAQAQAQQPRIEIKEISVTNITSPDYTFTKSEDFRSRGGEWLLIEVELENKEELVSEIAVRFHVVTEKMANRSEGPQYFTGEVTYINLFKNRSLFGSMYLPPNSLKFVNEGREVKANDVAEVGVEILYQGAIIAQANMKDNNRGPWWQSMQPLQGHMLNKNQTPFAPLYWDRYEQIKATP